jgi:ClpX C4-type zinc finger
MARGIAEPVRCTFCLTPAPEVAKIIAGPGVYICDRCVRRCVSILESGDPDEEQLPSWGSLDDLQLLERLPRIAAVAAQVDDTLHRWVAEARRRGVSWERIGSALAISRQSAWERFAVD